MIVLTEMEKEAVKDLLSQDGWKILVAKIKDRRESEIHALVYDTDPIRVVRNQARIQALEELMRLPQELIRGGEHA